MHGLRRVSCLILALLLVAVSMAPSSAQTDTGAIVLTVTDAKTGKPVVDARAMLVGPQVASSLTGTNGIIRYTDAPAGLYRVRVLKRGYSSAVSPEFEVLSGRSVALDVKLSESLNGPPIIGTVTARSQVSVSSHDISDDSPIRRISDSLTDALNKLAGVSVNQDATDPNSAVTVSLNGHDEAQTSVTLDGIPLGAPGAAANLRNINTDLFHGASVNFSPTAGALGGGVNFRTLQPTKTWIGQMSGSYGTYDRANYQLGATGSLGRLGIAVEHTFRNGNNPLTFQVFEDQSGLTYPHGGDFHNLGDFLKLRYAMPDDRTTISATGISSNFWNASICTTFTGALPCGFGPNNNNYGSFRFGYVTVQSTIGEVTSTVSAYATGSSNNANFSNQYIAGTPFPLLTVTGSDSRGIAYSFAISPGRSTITLSGSTYAASQSSIPIIGTTTPGGSLSFQTPFVNAVSANTYQLADAYKLSNYLTLTPNVSLANTTGAGTSLLAGAGMAWRPQQNDSIGLSLALGSSQPGNNVNLSFGAPARAQINCGSGVAIVSGPGDQPQHQSALNGDLNWTHQFRRGQFTIDLYRQTQGGQLITALVNQANEPAGYFPPGYIDSINQFYSQTCGQSVPFAQNNLYVQQPLGGTARLYQGVNFSGRFALGHYFVALPTYSLNEAVLTQADALLLGAASTTIVGAQLPNRPIHHAGLTLDGLLPRSGLELLANLQYTGANNQQNLPPYTVFTAGVSRNLGPGRLTIFESNIFNAYGYDFATNAFAVPLPLNGGGFLPTVGRPLAPRQLNFAYTMKIGGPPPIAALRTVASAPNPAPNATPRGFRLNLATPPPGADAFSVATTRDTCTADDQKLAQPMLAGVRAYVNAYEAKRTPQQPQDVEIVPHANADGTYVLEMRARLPQLPGAGGGPAQQRPQGGPPGGGFNREGSGAPPVGPPGGPIVVQSQPQPTQAQIRQRQQQFQNNPRFRALRAFVGCAYVAALSTEEARAKGVAAPARGPALYYAPGTGLFVVRPPQLPQGGGSLAPSASPSPGPQPSGQ
ncbi:MAG TPA: TonB-dependent receptor [Candidatus Binatia bacterium]|nr:TonB-dependent receptor [Candidatus Binatia bacterium]